jgi:uncharacterized membrane protein
MKTLFRKTVHFIQAHPKLDIAVLILGLAVFLTVTFINAPRASIWFDEAFSAYITQFNFLDIARYTASDVHPPLYYWILKLWTGLFGTTDLGYRSLSIVFGAGAITTAFFLTRKLFGRKVSWVTLLFLVVSPMIIRYSDEARMYTLAALIVMAATYVLIKANETKSRKLWILYGVLVSLGMWTHYFTAFAWLAHLAWHGTQIYRKGMGRKAFWKKLFSKEWLIAYAVAVGLYLPWLPFMALQLGIVQGSGFWIGPVSVNTPANYFTNIFYYLEHDQVEGWFALALLTIVVLLIVLIPKVYKALAGAERKTFLLVTILAWLPPVLLFLVSMPPLRSSFVERYLMPAIIAFTIFMAVVFVVGTRRWKPVLRALPILVIVGMMIFGITNVYKYGNFNKNTNYHIFTRQVIEQIREKAQPGEPIVAQTPWVFYEAIPYATPDHPVYFIDATADYRYGSLAMLKDNDMHKIKDITAFEKEHPTIWFIGQNENGDLPPYQSSWVPLQSVSVHDDITDKTIYRATEFRVSQ